MTRPEAVRRARWPPRSVSAARDPLLAPGGSSPGLGVAGTVSSRSGKPSRSPGECGLGGASSEPRRGESRSALQDNRGGPGLGAASCPRRGFLLPELESALQPAAPGFVRNRVLAVDETRSQCLSVGAARRFLPPGSATSPALLVLMNTLRACHPGGAVRCLYGVVKIP